MPSDTLKASSVDTRTKITIIKTNREKYSISAMFKVLNVSRSLVYYKQKKKALDVVVSDLTYVNISGKWNYICIILDLFNREIIGYAAGKRKSAKLVYKAFSRIKKPLSNINILHTDRDNEFKMRL